MEDIIMDKLCGFCRNRNTNCMKYKKNKQNNIIVYKCINYAKNEDKIKGYDEDWIDKTLTKLGKKLSKEVTNENSNSNYTKVKKKQSADNI